MRALAPSVLTAALVGALALAGCTPRPVAPSPAPDVSDPNEPVACTMEFRTVGVRIVTASGAPVTDARLQIRRADGTDLVCPLVGEPTQACVHPREFALADTSNLYVVATDNTPLSPDGENITVTATSEGRSVASVFRLRKGVCHVEKVSGPDVLTLGR